MYESKYKLVHYHEYCPKCQNEKSPDTEDPCDECLRERVMLDSHKPLNFKEKEG